MKQAIIAAATIVFFWSATAYPQCCYNDADLSGVWRSDGAEDLGNGMFGFREYRFSPKTYSGSLTCFSDRNMKNPILTYRTEGTYTVNEESDSAARAFNTAFRFRKKSITLHTADRVLINRFGLDECGLRKDEEKDISEKGCSSFQSVEAYPVEYDIVRREGNAMFFGKRKTGEQSGSEITRPMLLGPRLMLIDSKPLP